MSRKKGLFSNEGKTYTVDEYKHIFDSVLMGYRFNEIARVLKRKVEGIKQAWYRLCHNATDYSDKKIYSLYSSSERPVQMNGFAKEYIYTQWNVVKKKPTVQELSERMGISKERLCIYIEKNEQYWVTKPKNTLF